MAKIFISHASADNRTKIIDELFKILEPDNKVFYSSLSNTGIALGEYLHKEINEQLEGCDLYIAIITNNFLKSQHCIYELSIARFLSKKVIAIYADPSTKENISHIANSEWISIDLDGKSASEKQVLDLIKSLSLHESDCLRIKDILNAIAGIKKDVKAYIGMSQAEFENLLLYCQNNGIKKLGNKAINDVKIRDQKISHSKNLYIIATTGTSLFKTLMHNAIPSALRNGANINIIIPDVRSQFCEDVALCETYRDNEVIQKQNSQRIQHEFYDSILFLNKAYAKAKSDGISKSGSIKVYCCGTLLRQTLLMAELDNEFWGWLTMTMPPLLAVNTPTISFEVPKDNKYESIGDFIKSHCECLISVAERKYQTIEITGETDIQRLDTHSREDVRQYWASKYKAAVAKTSSMLDRSSCTLIEVSAQHPLIRGRYPNEEFTARLNHAVELFKNNLNENYIIYVPGSRHRINDDNDKISLSKAGVDYLLQKGIPKERIFGNEINNKYMKDAGVYNSSDECYAASKLYTDKNCNKLICICSPYQIMRKTFYYLEHGIIPECHSITSGSMYHNPISEYFESLHSAVYDHQNWQDPNSSLFINSRKDRRPLKKEGKTNN